MAYTPTEWQTGDVVTAAKLNHMENGIEALNCLVIEVNEQNDYVSDVTREACVTAYQAGKTILIYCSDEQEKWDSVVGLTVDEVLNVLIPVGAGVSLGLDETNTYIALVIG